MRKNETRPEGYPKLENYTPTRFMLPTSHYDRKKADRAVNFVEMLRHTQGKWAGKRFWLLPWQEQIIRDIFGTVKEDGRRQFQTAYVEISKKNGKSELAAAIALYMLYADGEAAAEVYGCAADREQASMVFDVAKRMVEMEPALLKRSKNIANLTNAGKYHALSAEVGTKHGLNVSGLVFDELHAQPNRDLYDVMTKGSAAAREQPLFFLITTAGNSMESICYEVHSKAKDILDGRREDPTFYPVIYGLGIDEDWHDTENWKKANPSLGHTVTMENMRKEYLDALENPADEIVFRQLRLNTWVGSHVAWIPDYVFMMGDRPVTREMTRRRSCYAGLDLSTTTAITAFVMVFPPDDAEGEYLVVPHFWIPREKVIQGTRRDHVPYDRWERQGFIHVTEGNVVDYQAMRRDILALAGKHHMKEIAYDDWNATETVQELDREGMPMVPFRQGIKSFSSPMKETYRLFLQGRIRHGGNPVLRWMAGNVVAEMDASENIKPNKKKSNGRIDGIVALIMAMDRCIRHAGKEEKKSVYGGSGRGLVVL